MTLTANFAKSRYAGIEYGVRGPALYTGSTSDAVTGSDGLAEAAACCPATSDSATGGDNVTTLASCVPSTADAVAGGDGIAANAICSPVTSDGISNSDFLDIIAGFYDECISVVIALDGSIYQYFRPVNVFTLEKEKRTGLLADEVREAAAHTRKQASARRENRQGASTDNRSAGVKSDNREFEA